VAVGAFGFRRLLACSHGFGRFLLHGFSGGRGRLLRCGFGDRLGRCRFRGVAADGFRRVFGTPRYGFLDGRRRFAHGFGRGGFRGGFNRLRGRFDRRFRCVLHCRHVVGRRLYGLRARTARDFDRADGAVRDRARRLGARRDHRARGFHGCGIAVGGGSRLLGGLPGLRLRRRTLRGRGRGCGALRSLRLLLLGACCGLFTTATTATAAATAAAAGAAASFGVGLFLRGGGSGRLRLRFCGRLLLARFTRGLLLLRLGGTRLLGLVARLVAAAAATTAAGTRLVVAPRITAAAAALRGLAGPGFRFLHRLAVAEQEAPQAGQQAGCRWTRYGANHRCGVRGWVCQRLVHRLLDRRRAYVGEVARQRRLVFRFGELVAGAAGLAGDLVGTLAQDLVVRRFHVGVGVEHDLDLAALLEADEHVPLLIQQEGGGLDRQLRHDAGGALLHGLFLDQAQHGQ